jgi:hypothetical protein
VAGKRNEPTWNRRPIFPKINQRRYTVVAGEPVDSSNNLMPSEGSEREKGMWSLFIGLCQGLTSDVREKLPLQKRRLRRRRPRRR